MLEFEQLPGIIRALGADRASLVPVEKIAFEPSFRKLCEANSCGMYGKSWMCPPYIGPVDALIAKAKQYRTAIVFQTVDTLEDSFDIEGMLAAGERINRLSCAVRARLQALGLHDFLLLGAGGCRICQRCAKITDEPCRFPEMALSSLEAYGVNVSALAPLAGMQYINGQDTVTYFGAVFLPGGT